MCSYIRPGGLAMDLPEEFEGAVRKVLDHLPARIDEYEALLTKNGIWRERTIGVGILKLDDAIRYSITGPNLRASGGTLDLRKFRPYCGYDEYDFEVPTGTKGDVYERYLVRIREMRESVKIARQALDRLPSGPHITNDRKVAFPPRSELATSMEALIHHFKLATEGYRVPAGEIYSAIESPRGELGFYIISDGSARPYRMHVRAPSFANMQALPVIVKGSLVSDLVATIGSLDPVMGEVDR
jgi:NADH-quinone oxidoreductase subunit D